MDIHQWQRTGKWHQFQDQAIFCQCEGNGEPLLLLHGFPSASWDWHKIWPDLAKRFQVLTLDFLGFGFSDKPQGYSYSIFKQADLVEQFLNVMGVSRCHLLSHDYGDTVAQELLARHNEHSLPFQLGSICFLNGGLFPEVHQPLFIQNLLSSPIGNLVSRLITRKRFEVSMSRLFSPQSLPDEVLLAQFWELIEYNNGRAIIHLLIKYMEERRCHRHRWVDALQESDIPLCLINGLDSLVSGEAMADRFESLLQANKNKRVSLVRLGRVGHYPQIEEPQKVLKYFLRFRHDAELFNSTQ